jgi:hypothetical protein
MLSYLWVQYNSKRLEIIRISHMLLPKKNEEVVWFVFLVIVIIC